MTVAAEAPGYRDTGVQVWLERRPRLPGLSGGPLGHGQGGSERALDLGQIFWSWRALPNDQGDSGRQPGSVSHTGSRLSAHQQRSPAKRDSMTQKPGWTASCILFALRLLQPLVGRLRRIRSLVPILEVSISDPFEGLAAFHDDVRVKHPRSVPIELTVSCVPVGSEVQIKHLEELWEGPEGESRVELMPVFILLDIRHQGRQVLAEGRAAIHSLGSTWR
jgi:hypothetical protein